jgi:hypothetical protein
VRLSGKSPEGNVDTVVSVPQAAVSGPEGSGLLRILAARETIRSLIERGGNHRDEVIRRAVEAGIASRYTSFVAVERRDNAKAPEDMDLVIVPQCAPRRRPQPPKPAMMMQGMSMRMCAMAAPPAPGMGGGGGGGPQMKSRKKKSMFSFSSKSSAAPPAPMMNDQRRSRARDQGPSSSSAKCESAAPVAMALCDDADEFEGGMSRGDSGVSESDDDNDDCFAAPAPAPASAPAPPAESSRAMAAPAPAAPAGPAGPAPHDARPDTLLRCQKADGRWEINDKLCAAIAGTTGQGLASASLGAGGKDGPSTVWATALAIAALRTRYTAMREEWAMIEDKGVAWLNKRLGNADRVAELLETATKMLAAGSDLSAIAAGFKF